MEHLWNVIYLLIGAVIATAAGIFGEKIKNFGKVFFELKNINLDEIFKKENDSIGGRRKTDILESIKVHCKMSIINSSNEQKICRDIKIKVKSADRKIEEEYECYEAENRIHNHHFIFEKKFDTLNLNSNSVSEKYFFFYLPPPEGNTFDKDLFIKYKNKKNRKREYLIYNLKFEISKD